jgi:pyruvate dehydrogenase E1 component alpha subunit
VAGTDRSRSENVASKRANQELPVIARFEVRRRNYLAPDGSINRPLPAFAADTNLLVALYRSMVVLRLFDRKAVALQRTGRLGTYAVSLGQEAVSVGIASAMRKEDVLLPSYRDNGALLWRGVKLEEILLFWGGDERGNHFSGPGFPVHASGQRALRQARRLTGWRAE